MNFKAILGYASAIGGALAVHAASLPWWVSVITAAVGTASAHYADKPGAQ